LSKLKYSSHFIRTICIICYHRLCISC